MKGKRKSAVGATPYGWQRRGNFLIEDSAEKNIISDMRRLKEEKNFSLRKIADYLNANSIPSKQFSIWYSNTVGDVLEREIPVKIENIQDCLCLNGSEQ